MAWTSAAVTLWKYVAVAHGDLGMSYERRQPVLDIILERLPNAAAGMPSRWRWRWRAGS